MNGNNILSIAPDYKSGGLEYAVAQIDEAGVVRVLLEDKTINLDVCELVGTVVGRFGSVTTAVFDKWAGGVIFEVLNDLGIQVVSPVTDVRKFIEAEGILDSLLRNGDVVGVVSSFVSAFAVVQALKYKKKPITFSGEI